MNWKPIVFVIVIVVIGVIIWLSGMERPSEPAHQHRPAESGESAMQQQNPHGEHGPSEGTELPTVATAKVAVQAGDGTSLGAVDLVPGERVALPNTPYQLRMTEFYTHWNMGDSVINLTRGEVNPAVRIEVMEEGEVLYSAWGFKNMPFFRMNMHQGQDGENTTLAFTLMTYEGLEFASNGEDQ